MYPTRDKGESEDGKLELAMNENMAASTVSMNTTSTASPFQQHPPPSPLSGCYLLVVLPEPHTAQHKDLILNRLAKGFLSWDKDNCHVDLTKELQALVAQSPEGEEARNGERLIQYATENLVTEILIHPQTNTLLQCIRNLLASFTKHRHIIHAGYTFNENGSWILQDGTFSLADFLDAFNEHDVQRVLRAYENSVTIDINCANIGDWSGQRLTKNPSIRSCRIRLNPDDILTAGMPAITNFTNYISQYLVSQSLDELMRPSDVVGNIRFSHPTLYVFPGGQGDAALFGINGFNMLVDGGFARKSCFWDFTRHLDRLDAVLFTRLNNSNIGGMSSVLKKKKEMHVYPQIGHFFCNLVERKHVQSPDGDKDLDPLVLSLIDLGQEMMINLRHINLRPHPCYRNYEPINLYHKVGHGTLDMYVLSPTKDSREVKDFLTKWNATDWKLFESSHKKDTNNMVFPIQNLISICALLIWQPANPDNTITRLLFPGSTPQHKIFEGLQRLNHLEFLKHPTCTAKSISPSTSLVSIKDKSMKQILSNNDKETKRTLEVKKQKRETVDVKKTESIQHQQQQQPPIIKMKKGSNLENKKLDEVKDYPKVMADTRKSEKVVKDTKKESKKDTSKNDKDAEMRKFDIIKTRTDSEKIAIPKVSKNKMEQKKKELKETSKLALKSPKTESKLDNSVEQMVKMSTPKKNVNASSSKVETSKVMTSKFASKSTIKTALPPAKSTKDANNRKVVEQKNIEKMSMTGFNSSSKLKSTGISGQSEKKAVTRQPKTTSSPSKSRTTGSPVKSGKTIPISAKSEKNQIVNKLKSEKGTADASTALTPSVIEIDTIKYVDKSLTEKSEDMSFDSIESKVLADLKEEREVVEEIEAVLKKAERKESVAADTEFEGGAEEETTEENNRKDEDVTEDDITADIDDIPRKGLPMREARDELTEEDEYLIIEKEEIYTSNLADTPAIKHQDILDTTDMEKNQFVQPIGKKEVNDRPIVEQTPGEEEEEEEEKDDGGGDDDDDDEDDNVGDDDDDDDDDNDDDNDGIDDENDEVDKDEQVEVEVDIDEDEVKANIPKVVEDEEREDNVVENETGDDDIEKDVEKGILEEREKTEDDPEKCTLAKSEEKIKGITHDKYAIGITEYKEQLEQEMKGIITSAAKIIQKTEKKNEIGKKDDDEITKESPSVTTEQLGSSEKKTIDTDVKPDIDLKEPCNREKLEESQERISTIESGATTTAPTLPEDERIPSETFNRNSFEKQMIMEDVRRIENVGKAKIIPLTAELIEGKSDARIFGTRHPIQTLPRDIVKTPDEVADLPVHEEVDPKLYEMGEFGKSKEEKLVEHKNSKEQKRVSGFLGKVADKIEKGMDKVTEKSTQDIEKDVDEKSSSKSTSPKEINDVVNTVPEIDSKKTKDIVHTKIQEEILKIPHETEPKKSTKDDEMCSSGDIEDVEALLEEASKKFRSVKDSLRDSLESLEEPIIIDEFQTTESGPTVKADEIKGTLDEVAEKLEEIKFVSPKDIEIKKKDIEEQTFSLKDVKEAMRDVGEVLAGTAGIVIETQPKDVIQIVKKVAEVLKEDDFLSEKNLFTEEATKDNEQKNSSIIDECNESPVIKHVIDNKPDIMSSKIDDNLIKYEATMDYSDSLPEDVSNVGIKSSLTDASRSDDADDEIKLIGEHEDIHRTSYDNKDQRTDMKSPDITFDRKLQPVTAELVVVTPDSFPESAEENLQDETEKNICDLNEVDIQVPINVKDTIHKTENIDEAIERLILVDKIKITIKILEYIVNIKRMPRQKVISIIKDIINRNKIDSNIVSPEILDIEWNEPPVDKELEIEEYINDQYIKKSIKITHSILDYIATEKSVPISIVVEIIKEIILKKHITLDEVLHMNEKELREIFGAEEENVESETEEKVDANIEKEVKTREIHEPTIEELQSELENELMTEYIDKGQKISDDVIKNICQRGIIPQQMIIKIIDEMKIKRKLLEQDVDISTSMWDILKSSDTVQIDEKETINLIDNNFVHDFVIIPSNDPSDNIGVTTQTGDIEITVSDDFEAVEQEYKSSVVSDESNSKKAQSEAEEAMEDSINNEEEADDKIVTPVSGKTIDQVNKIALADEALEVNEAAIVQDELSAKSSEKKENLILKHEIQLADSFTVKQEVVTSMDEENDKSDTLKRLAVTTAGDDGGEETELSVSDNMNNTKPSISDNLLSSPTTITMKEETVCSRVSTPDIENVSDIRSPVIKEHEKTIADSSIEETNTTMDILSPSKKEKRTSITDAVGQIITDDKSPEIHEIEGKPSDIVQSEHASPVECIVQTPTVNFMEDTEKSSGHNLTISVDDKVTELTSTDGFQDRPEEEQIASKLSSDHVKLRNELSEIQDHPISISNLSITHSEKEKICEEKSLSPGTDSTFNIKGSIIGVSRTTPTDQSPKMIEEDVAKTAEPEKKLPIPKAEDLESLHISTDNSVLKKENFAEKSPQVTKTTLSDEMTPNLFQANVENTSTLMNESSYKIDGLPMEPTSISDEILDESKCRITKEKESSQVLSGFSSDKHESHISSGSMHSIKIDSPIKETGDKPAEHEEISFISQRTKDEPNDNDEINQTTLVKQMPCLSKAISPALSEQDENMEDLEKKVNEESVRSNVDEIRPATIPSITTTPTKGKTIDEQLADSNADESTSPVASPISHSSKLTETFSAETTKSIPLTADLESLTSHKSKDLEIATKVIETTCMPSSDKDNMLLTSSEHQSQKDVMVENEKSPDVICDSHSQTSQKIVVTETEEKITDAKSVGHSDDQNKTETSIFQSPTHTDIIIDKKEKSLSPTHEKSISPNSNDNKSLEPSPVSQPTPSNENTIIEQEKVSEATPVALIPDLRDIEKNVDIEIIDDKSPEAIKSGRHEGKKSPSPTQNLPKMISSNTYNTDEIDEKVTHEIPHGLSADQNKSPVSSSVPKPLGYDENIIVEKENVAVSHDFPSPKKIEDAEKLSKEITDTKSTNQSTDQHKSPIVSSVSQPQIAEENIIHAEEKSPSPTRKSSTSIPDENDISEIQKSISESSTGDSAHQIESKLSPTTQSSSSKENIVIESNASLSLTPQLFTQTSDRTVFTEVDKKTISSNEKEMNKKVIDETVTHASANEVESTSSSPIAQASYREASIISENIKPLNEISQSPIPTLNEADNRQLSVQKVDDKLIIPGTDQSKSSLSPSESGSPSPDNSIVFETKELSTTTTADFHSRKSSMIENMEINENIITTKSTSHSTPSCESGLESPVPQSSSHEKSINVEKEKPLSPTFSHLTPIPSNNDETKIIKEMDDKKSIIPTVDQIMSPVSSQSPSHDQSAVDEKKNLPSPMHELVSPTPEKSNEEEMKKQVSDNESNIDNKNKSPVQCLSPSLEDNIIHEEYKSQSLIQEKRSSISSKTDGTEMQKEMNDEDSNNSSIDQYIASLPCKSLSPSVTPSQSSSHEDSLMCQKKGLSSQQHDLIPHQAEDTKSSKDLDCSQFSPNSSDEHSKSSISPVKTSLDIMEGTEISSRDIVPDLSLSISSEVEEANSQLPSFQSRKKSLISANNNDVDTGTINVSHTIANIQRENILTDSNDDNIQEIISPSIHTTPSSRKESFVNIADKNTIDSKSVTSLPLEYEYSETGAINCEPQLSTTAEILSSSVSIEKIVHENESSKLTETSSHHIEETCGDDSTIDMEYREDSVIQVQTKSVVDKNEPLQDRSSSHNLFEADEKMPEGQSTDATLINDKEEIEVASMSKNNGDEDASLKPTQGSAKGNIELSHVSTVQRIGIEDHITEMFIKPKKKISMKLLLEMAELKEVTIDIILVIIKYFIMEKNIPIESLVDDELSSKIQKDLVFKVTDEIEEKEDSKHEVKKEEIKEIDSCDIMEKPFISKEKKLEIEKYLMDDYINKGKIITSLVLNDMEKMMVVSRYALLEILAEVTTRLKLPQESVYDDVIYSEIISKKIAKEHLSGKSTPERKSSGYSTPEVKNYNEKFESQFHKAFMDGMTEIRTTHITTLSGKSTPDVITNVNYPDSELSSTKITGTDISQCVTHVVKEISGPVATKHITISSTEDSPECKTVVERTIIEQEILEEDSEEKANIEDTIQEKNIDEQNDQHEIKKTMATVTRHDYTGSVLTDNKCGRSTPDKLQNVSDRPCSTTPEGFRAGEIIKTVITTTRTVSEEGEIITTTKEVTETINERGETTVMAEKVDVIVADRTAVETEPSTIETIQSSDNHPHSDEINLPEVISSSQSFPISQEWTEKKGRQQDSDTKVLGDSPISITSQVYHYEKCDEPTEFSTADMSSSFYGQLPDIPPSRNVDISTDAGSSGQTETGTFTSEKMFPEKQINVQFSSKQHTESSAHYADEVMEEKSTTKSDDDSNGKNSRTDTTSSIPKDPLQEWGTPLKLPPPERPEKFNLRTNAIIRSVDISPDSLDFDVIHDWGEPMRLPSPTQTGVEDTAPNKIASSTMKKDVKQPRKVISENLKNKKYLESPTKNEKKLKESKNKIQPIYLDLTYVPHHGNSYYASLEFFKRIRARYYVFSGTEPSREVYDALLNAKKTWENKNLEVTIIPTYDTDTLGYWVADNEEALAINRIDLSPSASRCTINLQDHETSCSAYRLEF